ncbi:MAG TPA: hypothetical protein VFW34_11175, partial [Candidatus Rubrimentiphilum sp.]|nr:hypothetical protein [Candidatus Rubrimentiphilum sp.]
MTLLAALLGATLLSVSGNDASVLLAKHTQYVGWQAGDPSMQGWSASGTRTNGRANDTFAEKRSGIAYRDTLTAAGGRISMQTGFTGTTLWQSDPNGFTVTQSGMPAQVAYDLNLIRAETLSSATRGASNCVSDLTVTGSARVRGTDTTILTVKPACAPPVDIYEDPTTGAFLQAIIDPNGPARTLVSIDAYAEVAPGKKAVSQWTVGSAQYTLTSISAAHVADSDLIAPAPTATWSFGDQSVPVDL